MTYEELLADFDRQIDELKQLHAIVSEDDDPDDADLLRRIQKMQTETEQNRRDCLLLNAECERKFGCSMDGTRFEDGGTPE